MFRASGSSKSSSMSELHACIKTFQFFFSWGCETFIFAMKSFFPNHLYLSRSIFWGLISSFYPLCPQCALAMSVFLCTSADFSFIFVIILFFPVFPWNRPSSDMLYPKMNYYCLLNNWPIVDVVKIIFCLYLLLSFFIEIHQVFCFFQSIVIRYLESTQISAAHLQIFSRSIIFF